MAVSGLESIVFVCGVCALGSVDSVESLDSDIGLSCVESCVMAESSVDSVDS